MKNKHLIQTLALVLTLATTFSLCSPSVVNAKTKNNLKQPTTTIQNKQEAKIINIADLKRSDSIKEFEFTYSNGKKEHVIINNNNLKIIDESANKTIVDENVQIQKPTITTQLKRSSLINSNGKIKPDYQTDEWYLVRSYPKYNMHAAGQRVSAVVSLFAAAVEIPGSVAYGVISSMYTIATGNTLPNIFTYYCDNWYCQADMFSDIYNSSNGKMDYGYWWKNTYEGNYNQYFKWKDIN